MIPAKGNDSMGDRLGAGPWAYQRHRPIGGGGTSDREPVGAPGLLVDGETRPRLIRDMAIYIISEAKPKLGALVKQASAGETVYLLNGKDMVALVPARPTHDPVSNLDVERTNRRLAASERTPSAPWSKGDAARLAKQVLKTKPQ